jgi:hypothetical protein
MNPPSQEQRNPYKGNPSRAWIHLQLAAPDGTLLEIDALADTGNPFFLIVGCSVLRQFKVSDSADVPSNFGLLEGGAVNVRVPEIGLDRPLIAYGNDTVLTAVRGSSPAFDGLVGLPLLQLAEFGGDARHFWIRAAAGSP